MDNDMVMSLRCLQTAPSKRMFADQMAQNPLFATERKQDRAYWLDWSSRSGVKAPAELVATSAIAGESYATVLTPPCAATRITHAKTYGTVDTAALRHRGLPLALEEVRAGLRTYATVGIALGLGVE